MTPAHVASFEAVRPRLFGIACRTLESTADAAAVVQHTWIRWQGTGATGCETPPRFSPRSRAASRSTSRNPLGFATRRPSTGGIPNRSTFKPIPRSAWSDASARARDAHAHGEAVSQRTSHLRAPSSTLSFTPYRPQISQRSSSSSLLMGGRSGLGAFHPAAGRHQAIARPAQALGTPTGAADGRGGRAHGRSSHLQQQQEGT
jgi:hypothetical protein